MKQPLFGFILSRAGNSVAQTRASLSLCSLFQLTGGQLLHQEGLLQPKLLVDGSSFSHWRINCPPAAGAPTGWAQISPPQAWVNQVPYSTSVMMVNAFDLVEVVLPDSISVHHLHQNKRPLVEMRERMRLTKLKCKLCLTQWLFWGTEQQNIAQVHFEVSHCLNE